MCAGGADGSSRASTPTNELYFVRREAKGRFAPVVGGGVCAEGDFVRKKINALFVRNLSVLG